MKSWVSSAQRWWYYALQNFCTNVPEWEDAGLDELWLTGCVQKAHRKDCLNQRKTYWLLFGGRSLEILLKKQIDICSITILTAIMCIPELSSISCCFSTFDDHVATRLKYFFDKIVTNALISSLKFQIILVLFSLNQRVVHAEITLSVATQEKLKTLDGRLKKPQQTPGQISMQVA